MPRATRPTVSVLAFDGMSPFELGCVVEIFGIARPELEVPWYELSVCAESPADLRITGGFTMRAEHGLDMLVAADTVIVPGVADVHGEVSHEVVAALRRARDRGAGRVDLLGGVRAGRRRTAGR